MTLIYGVQYSTDSRDDGRETFERFRSEHSAQEWMHQIGFNGIGPSFGPQNGHRYIRQIYAMSTGWRKTAKHLTWGEIRANGYRIKP
ncbi:MAG: hypothetical protein ACR2P3_10095 [Geminicoccaceae bacterium]